MDVRYSSFAWDLGATSGDWISVGPGQEVVLPFGTRWILVRAKVSARDLGEGRELPIEELKKGRSFTKIELPEPAVKGEAALKLTLALSSEATGETITFVLDYPPKNKYKISCENRIFSQAFDTMVSLAREWTTQNILRENITWENLLQKLDKNEDPAPYALVTELAQNDLSDALSRIYEHPRKILRRVRQAERIHRVRETDIGCLMHLCQQPGRTIREKAGEKQRILAIKRMETKNTLENRVAKHCVVLADREASGYLGEYLQLYDDSNRVKRVRRMQRTIAMLKRSSELEEVDLMNTPCRTPNYALLQNIHYHKVWEAYTELVRNFDLKANLRRWARRQWADLCLVNIIRDSEPEAEGWVPVWGRLAQLKREPEMGKWLLDDSTPGPWLSPDKKTTLYLADRCTQSALLPGLEWLHADYCWIEVGPAKSVVKPIYCVWELDKDVPQLEQLPISHVKKVQSYFGELNMEIRSPLLYSIPFQEQKTGEKVQNRKMRL